jgi:hypothetical protein
MGGKHYGDNSFVLSQKAKGQKQKVNFFKRGFETFLSIEQGTRNNEC